MKRSLSIILVLSFLLTSCGQEVVSTHETTKDIKYVKTEKLEEKGFVENLKLIGKVASSEQTTISPLASGTIKAIKVEVGDKVKAGDVLATIGTQSNLVDVSLSNAGNTYKNTLTVYNSTKTQLEKNLETTKLQYENAIKTRDNTYKSTDKQLELAQSSLESTQSEKTNTLTSNGTAIQVAQNNLENAKLALSNFNKNAEETNKSLESKKNATIDNMRVSVVSSLSTFDPILTQVDTILGATEKNKGLNDEYETYLSAKNIALKTQSETKFFDAQTKYNELKSTYNNSLAEQDLVNFYPDIIGLADKMIDLCDKTVLVLDNSITSASFSDVTLSALKAGVVAYRSQAINTKSSLVSSKNTYTEIENTINSTHTSNETQKQSYEQAVKIAQSSLDNTKASTNSSNSNLSSSEKTANIQLESTQISIKSSRDSADNSVAIAKAQYESALANYNASLASNKSQLDTAAGNINSSEQQKNNTLITAPFDGVITEKNISIGQSVSAATQAFSISNSSKKIIQLDVTSGNISYFSVDKEVRLQKNDQSGSGKVRTVGVASDTITGMYKVEVSIEGSTFGNLLSLGSYIDVYVQKGIMSEKHIIVPFSSLIAGSNSSYSVYIVDSENKVVKKEVTIGESNSSEVVIKSGLQVGDRIIIQGSLNVSAGDSIEEK